MTAGDKAILVALDLMRQSIVALPLAIAYNAANSVNPNAPPAGGGGPAGGGPAGSAALLGRTMRRAADVAGLLAARFGAMLGPMAVFGRVLEAPTSGMNLLGKSMGLLAASIGPVLLPLTFSLAVGLATAGDVIFKKLMPAMDAFTRFVLQTGIPAMTQFADTVGRATEALKALANSKAGGVIAGDSGGGGTFGGLNRTLDRVGAPL